MAKFKIKINWLPLARVGLTIALIAKVYGETGPFTALSMTLIFIAFEIQAFMN
jgi:hypothetical protein